MSKPDYLTGLDMGLKATRDSVGFDYPIQVNRNEYKATLADGTIVSPVVNKYGELEVFIKGRTTSSIKMYKISPTSVLVSDYGNKGESTYSMATVADRSWTMYDGMLSFALGFFSAVVS